MAMNTVPSSSLILRSLSHAKHSVSKKAIPAASLDRCFTSGARDDEILHKSIVPTNHFQKSLPHLPIPALEKTCDRYLKAQKPLLTPKQYQETEAVTKSFQEGPGKALHDALVKRDKENKHTSYISAPWFDMYLRDRRAVALNHNPFMAFNDDPRPEYNDQLTRATNMLSSTMKFMKTYRAGLLEPEVYHLNPEKSDNLRFRKFVRLLPEAIAFYGAFWYKAFPLDMSQFPRLFNSTRIPRPDRDELYSDAAARHVLVMRNGRFYVFDVLDADGNIIPAAEMRSNLAHIMQDPSPPAEYPIGVMTTQNRDTWSAAREALVQAGNEGSLKKIDGALFNLVLDDNPTVDPIELSRLFLHGDGTNRWYDKSFSLIINGAGKACVNFEHSWGDGVAVLRWFNETFRDSTTNPAISPDHKTQASGDPTLAVQELKLNLTSQLKQTVTDAKKNFASSTSSLQLQYSVFDAFGKNVIKKSKLSPDSFMQLAIQMTYHKLYGCTTATYESCSTSAFKHGRTETIRPATVATKAACDQFACCPDIPKHSDELFAAMNDCSAMHGELTKQAAMGQGFDRHLFAMKYYAAQEGPVPDFYQDPSYTALNHIILSTSTLSSPAVLIGGFAPVVPDGFGIGYGIDDKRLGLVVTAYDPHQKAADFVRAFNESVTEMGQVIQQKA